MRTIASMAPEKGKVASALVEAALKALPIMNADLKNQVGITIPDQIFPTTQQIDSTITTMTDSIGYAKSVLCLSSRMDRRCKYFVGRVLVNARNNRTEKAYLELLREFANEELLGHLYSERTLRSWMLASSHSTLEEVDQYGMDMMLIKARGYIPEDRFYELLKSGISVAGMTDISNGFKSSLTPPSKKVGKAKPKTYSEIEVKDIVTTLTAKCTGYKEIIKEKDSRIEKLVIENALMKQRIDDINDQFLDIEDDESDTSNVIPFIQDEEEDIIEAEVIEIDTRTIEDLESERLLLTFEIQGCEGKLRDDPANPELLSEKERFITNLTDMRTLIKEKKLQNQKVN